MLLDRFEAFFSPLNVCLFLAVLGLCWCLDFSLVVASGGYSLVVPELLTVVAPLAEHGL